MERKVCVMKINVTIDLEDFMDDFSGEKIEKLIADKVKSEVLKKVKKDPRYRLYVEQKANDVINNLI